MACQFSRVTMITKQIYGSDPLVLVVVCFTDTRLWPEPTRSLKHNNCWACGGNQLTLGVDEKHPLIYCALICYKTPPHEMVMACQFRRLRMIMEQVYLDLSFQSLYVDQLVTDSNWWKIFISNISFGALCSRHYSSLILLITFMSIWTSRNFQSVSLGFSSCLSLYRSHQGFSLCNGLTNFECVDAASLSFCRIVPETLD